MFAKIIVDRVLVHLQFNIHWLQSYCRRYRILLFPNAELQDKYHRKECTRYGITTSKLLNMYAYIDTWMFLILHVIWLPISRQTNAKTVWNLLDIVQHNLSSSTVTKYSD